MLNKVLYDRANTPSFIEINMNRPGISAMMHKAVERPLTTIIANAGYGKTQAASTLMETSDARIIWLQLTKLDNIATRLWERLAHGIEPYNKTFSGELRVLGFPGTIASVNRFLKLLAESLELSATHYIVVLDDFQVIHDEHLLSSIELIVSAELQQLSIVIISDTQPRINLSSLYSKGMLSRITGDDLRMTRKEIFQYYDMQGIAVSEDIVAHVYNRTEGWIFAVYLMGLSMKKGTFSANDPHAKHLLDIFDLIETDIYQRMSSQQQRFLLVLSFLDDMSPELMRVLAEDNPEIISEVLRLHSTLLRFDPLTGRYRMMNLFREFMMKKHNDLRAEERAELNRTIARWYEVNEYEAEAIYYYKACGDFLCIFDIILGYRNRCPEEIANLFIEIVEQAPLEAIEEKAIVLVARAMYLINNRRMKEGREALCEIREKYEAMPDSQKKREVLGETYMLFGILQLTYKQLDFVDYFKRADALLPDGSSIMNNKRSLTVGASFITTNNLGPGSVKKMTDAFFEAMPYAICVMKGLGAGLDYLVAADADYAMGDIRSAEKNAYAAIYQAQRYEQYDTEYMGQSVLLRVSVYHGDFERAFVILETVRKYLNRIQIPDCISLCDIVVGWFYAQLGQPQKVAKWILEDSDVTKSLAPITMNRGQSICANCYLKEGRYYELLAYLEPLDAEYKIRYALLGQIENAVLRAIAYHYVGDKLQSMQALKKAYLLSYENGIIMPFIEQGKRMRTLLQAAKRENNGSIPENWLNSIYSKSSTYAKRLSQMTNSYHKSIGEDQKAQIRISKREQEMLICVCQGLTREQIAESCNLSINTVKSSLRYLYDKLGVRNSLEAVRIATSFNLIK